jgi:hypothetical protein
MSGSDHSFSLAFFGREVAVIVEDEELRRYLDEYFLPWIPRSPVPESQCGLRMSVRRTADSPSFLIESSKYAAQTAADLPAVLRDLMNIFDRQITARLSDVGVVHAGVVGWHGGVVLLPGLSHAGKTTLVRELIGRGLEFYSDEYAFIDSEGLVHPCPRPLMIREKGDPSRPVLASTWGAPVGRPARVRLIVALQRVDGASWDVRRLSQGEALLCLLSNTPQVSAETPGILGAFQGAVRDAACYSGSRGEASEAADRMLELLAHPR